MSKKKSFKVWWDEKDGIIQTQIFGLNNEQDVINTVSKIAEIKQKFPGKKLRDFIDLSQASKPSSRARKVIAEKIYKDPDLKRIALVSKSLINKTIQNFLIRATSESDKIKMFDTKKEALKWLKE